MSAPKNIFLSFSKTIESLADGYIVPKQLIGGLFFLGCRREFTTFTPEAGSKVLLCIGDDEPWPKDEELSLWLTERLESTMSAWQIVAAELRRAERQGRAMYRLAKPVLSWPRLNKLLVRNGLPALPPVTKEDYDGSYPPKADFIYRGRLCNLLLDGYSPRVADRLIERHLAGLAEVLVSQSRRKPRGWKPSKQC
jgi:hypothetical protein